MNSEFAPILTRLGFTALNQMQEETITTIISKNETVLISPTGSGKTLAFLLPLLKLMKPELQKVQVLIISPTRELALQTENVFRSLGTSFKINCCYGGHPFSVEKNNLTFPPAVLIGTPGRLAEHFRKGNVDPGKISVLVLDEFDKCLELGFQETMAELLDYIHPGKKVLTSATALTEIPVFTGIRKPTTLDFSKENSDSKAEIYLVPSQSKDKLETLFQLICSLGSQPMLVFCNHREAVDRISDFLWLHQIPNEAFHGGMDQDQREKALIQFRNKSVNCLVTTDLAARGLDISGVESIIHYHLPVNEQSFVHRNGRTARMHASGNVYLILHGEEKLPGYTGNQLPIYTLPENAVLPDLPLWKTLYFSGGKKDKINKIDLVGFLIQKGGLQKEEIGRIDVLDFMSFVAVASGKIQGLVKKISQEPVKKKKLKIEVV